MKNNSNKYHRRSIRLQGYDYSSLGTYFITVCTRNQVNIFGEIINGKMQLNNMGNIVKNTWNDLVNYYGNIKLDEFIVMPNHFHGIVVITDTVGAKIVGAIHELPLRTSDEMTIKERRNMYLPKIIGRFKMMSSKQINIIQKTQGKPVWQRNYWEHIIRNEMELNRVREYIIHNPENWQSDEHYAV